VYFSVGVPYQRITSPGFASVDGAEGERDAAESIQQDAVVQESATADERIPGDMNETRGGPVKVRILPSRCRRR